MISHQHEAIFIHIQKTGGEAISDAMGEPRDCAVKHWLARELRPLCTDDAWSRYFKFAFVRNPWARLVSWYSMINAKRAAYQRGEALNKFWSAVLARSQSFEDFLSNMDDEVFDPDGRKWIWRNQLDYLADESGALLVDFIGRTETLNEDFERVRQRLRGETKALLHVNVSAHDHYATYYTPELARLVEDRYARDIDYFGYRFEDWGKSSFPALKQKAKR